MLSLVETPATATDFTVECVNGQLFIKQFVRMHHRLLPNPPGVWRLGFVLTYQGQVFGVAVWNHPSSTHEDQTATLELLRMALLPDLPRNTASWMLAQMRKYIRTSHPHIKRLISYQDADLHYGTMYRADNWTVVPIVPSYRPNTWAHRVGRTKNIERRNRIKWSRKP